MWLINVSDKPLDVFIKEETRFQKFLPGQPVFFKNVRVALEYKQRYGVLNECTSPEKFFTSDRPFKQLIIRDAGIGDLLLLEPVLRVLKGTNHRESGENYSW